jgi:L-2,4-diaminobutyrate decarboxylase
MSSILKLYNPELFSQAAHILVEELATFLTQSKTDSLKTGYFKPQDMLALALTRLKEPRLATANFSEADLINETKLLAQDFLKHSTRLHSPHYMGHQVNPPIPLASMMSLLSSVSNTGLAVYEMSQFTAGVERALISALVPYLGWSPEHADGIVTSGGTIANLTALLAARNHASSQAWAAGLSGSKLAILTSADSHYSISRAAGVLGIGTSQVISLPLDSKRRIDPQQLDQVHSRALADGLHPFCLVGTSGSTPIGAFDDLKELGEFAHKHRLWFHIDAAHGGSLLLSQKHRSLLDGVELADSVTWDAHKMMFVPSLCTFLMYRDRKKSYLPFLQDAPYLFAGDQQDMRAYDGGLRTMECTKGGIALPVWAIWSLFGVSIFSELQERVLSTTQDFYQLLLKSRDFQVLHEPECNILCFRYLPEAWRKHTSSKIAELQQTLRTQIVQNGSFYITGTALNGEYVLRVTLIQPHIEREHLVALMNHIRALASHIE